MNFAFSEEQEQLREFVRQFLENYSPETAVRELMETEAGYDTETVDDGRTARPAEPRHP